MNIKFEDLKAKFYPGENMVEIYSPEGLIHTETLSANVDEWFGAKIGEEEVDFNLWYNPTSEKRLSLTMYPDFWEEDNEKVINKARFFNINLTIETK